MSLLFDDLFAKTKEKTIIYNNKIIHRALSIFGPKKLKLIITFIEKNSKYRQGVSVNMFTMKGKLTCNGITVKKGGFSIWEDTSPKQTEVDVEIDEGALNIFNFSERFDHRNVGYTVSMQMGTAFYYEEISANKYRCYCNDWEPDDDFDDLIFDIEFIEY